MIVNFRNGVVAAKSDVKKMYNCIQLAPEDAYMQCFLWRNLDPKAEPSTYQVVVNNIGVKPAGAIATVALQKSCDVFSSTFPVTSLQIKNKSYVDDLGLSANTKEALKKRIAEADQILKHANMHVKKWVTSGETSTKEIEVGNTEDMTLMDNMEGERMLGINWNPRKDAFTFVVRINLSPLRNKARIGPDLSREELLANPQRHISRRQYYSQVQSLFDPIGLLAVLLKAKVLLRRSWEGECASLKWDGWLLDDLVKDIVEFFVELHDLELLEFSRSLWPEEEIVGKPELLVFSDGSVMAFGAVSYIRWKLKSGNRWSTLVMSKSKISPKNRITIPRLELNGAVLAKRLKEFLVSQLDIKFANVYHLVDSSTVLGYVHK